MTGMRSSRELGLTLACATLLISDPTAGLEAQARPGPPTGVRAHYGVALGREFRLYDYGLTRPADDGSAVFMGALSLRGRVLATYLGRRHAVNGWLSTRLYAEVTGLKRDHFYGFGNNTLARRSSSFYRNNRYQFILRPTLNAMSGDGRFSMALGPELKYTTNKHDVEFFEFDLNEEFDDEDPNFLQASRPYGLGTFGQLGMRADLEYRTGRGSGNALLVRLGTSLQPAVFDVRSPFGKLFGLIGTRLGVGPGELALRAGGQKVWGDEIPFREGAYIGGNRSLRSQTRHRFTGDGAIYFGSELRVPVVGFNLFKRNLTGGVLGLADIGRVYYRGESPGGWHTAVGGGIWVSPPGSSQSISGAIAFGNNETRLYLTTRFLFR